MALKVFFSDSVDAERHDRFPLPMQVVVIITRTSHYESFTMAVWVILLTSTNDRSPRPMQYAVMDEAWHASHPAGLDEGLLPFSLSHSSLYVESP
jgi:hypothetical protein